MRRKKVVLGILIGIATAIALWAAEVLQQEEAPSHPSAKTGLIRLSGPAAERELEPPVLEANFVAELADPPPDPAAEVLLATERAAKLRELQDRERQSIEKLRASAGLGAGADVFALRELGPPLYASLFTPAGPLPVHEAALSPDGRRFAAVRGTGLLLHDLHDNKTATLVKDEERVTSLAFSPDGSALAFGSRDGRIRLWNAKGGEITGPLPVMGGPVEVLVWSPNGKTLAVGTALNEDAGELTLWDIASGQEQQRLGSKLSPVRSAAWTADGKLLVTLRKGSKWVQFWDPITGKEKPGPQRVPASRAFALSPDGKTMAAGGPELKLYDVRTREEQRTLPRDGMTPRSLSWSPDGKLLIGKMAHPALGDTRIRLWDLNSSNGPRPTRQVRATPFTVLHFSPGGLLLISADRVPRLLEVSRLLDPPPGVAALEKLISEIEKFAQVAEDRNGLEVTLSRQTSDGDLPALLKLPRLHTLDLRNLGQITDAGVAHLAGLTDVQHLNLKSTQMTDAGMSSIANMRQLQTLVLQDTRVTSKGLLHLKGLPALRSLTLSGKDICDEGLAALEGVKGLRVVYLWRTSVTSSGVARLKQVLPKLQVLRH